MSVDIRVNVTEDKENKNINIGVYIDRKEETDTELAVGRKLYKDVMELLDKTLPPSEGDKKEESSIITP
jgi:hypothetical protein